MTETGFVKPPPNEIAAVTKAVHARHGAAYRYSHTIVSEAGRYLGGADITTIHVFRNEATDWDTRRNVYVSNGDIQGPL